MPDTPILQPRFVQPTAATGRYVVPVQQDMLVAPDAWVMGGVTMGAAIEALQHHTGRSIIWATGQFLSYVGRDSTMELTIETLVEGHRTTQAHLRGTTEDGLFLAVMAALGHKPDQPEMQLTQAPDVPAPEDCEVETRRETNGDSLHSIVEKRRIPTPPGNNGRTRYWSRFLDQRSTTATELAIVADFLPGEMRTVLRRDKRSNSLDNTIRFLQIESTEWYLCDCTSVGLAAGYFHADMQIYARSGTLLATASQSGPIRLQ